MGTSRPLEGPITGIWSVLRKTAQVVSKGLFPATAVAAGTREEPWGAVQALSRQHLDKCILCTYYVPALVPGAAKIAENKTHKGSVSPKLSF